MDPITRFALLVLFGAQQDHARELVINPSPDAPGIRYNIDGKWHNFAPPPAHILPKAILELQRMGGIVEKPYPKEGMIEEPFGSLRLRWKIQLNSAADECVLTRIS